MTFHNEYAYPRYWYRTDHMNGYNDGLVLGLIVGALFGVLCLWLGRKG